MAKPSPWPAIHAERRALVADLQKASDEDWSRESLAAPWTVRDVFGHITDTARMTPPRFFGKLAGAGFNFKRMTSAAVQREREGTPADALNRFNALIDRTSGPPGPSDAMLGEIVLHGEDIVARLASPTPTRWTP